MAGEIDIAERLDTAESLGDARHSQNRLVFRESGSGVRHEAFSGLEPDRFNFPKSPRRRGSGRHGA
jgi:hypothetical protein